MSYQAWTWRDHHADIHFVVYLADPATLTQDRIAWMDRNAADSLKYAAQLVEDLTEYRQALAARYAALSVMPYKTRLELVREPNSWTHKIKYYVRMVREYEDGTTETELLEVYEGKQRRDALARFEALRKEHPGIETVKDIERKSWER